ncbi:hypothetical protein P8605_31135, partial [Streptomyces sp. T-3]|nr:hypothetical protein [Streptomyces sp. T-3]
AVYTLTSDETMLWRETRTTVRPPSGGARPAGASDVIALQEMVRVFALLAGSHGGAHARSALACYLSDDVGRLLHAPAPDVLRPQLFTLAAQLTHLLAAMTADAGHHGLAQHYFHTALLLAREADDREDFAITLRAMSVQALRLHRRRHAADLAQAAVDALTPTTHPAACSYVLAQRALTHATQHHVRHAEADLTAAERWHDQAAGPPGPFTAYPRAALDYQRAEALSALGRTKPALRAFQDSLRSRSAAQRKAQALTEARVAETALALGHLDAACAHWHTFLDQYPALRSDQADQALARMRSSLASFPRHALAQAVRERSRAVAGSTAAP